MNQFIIENPVLSIVIAYIIGAVVMHIISVLAIRKALGEDDEERIGLYPVKPSNAPAPPAPIVHDRVLPIWLGKDENGRAYIYFEEPTKYDGGTGPYGNEIPEVYYECESKVNVWLDDLMASTNPIITDLKNELLRMENLKYGVSKINLYEEDVVRLINVILGSENK